MGGIVVIIYIVFIICIVQASKKAGDNSHANAPKRQQAVPQKHTTSRPNVPRKQTKPKVKMQPHMEEHMEEYSQPKNKRDYSFGEDPYKDQRIIAIRLMEGDPVPEGYNAIRCNYCGAINLTTKNCREYHSCYFCHQPID